MFPFSLTPDQLELVHHPLADHVYLAGPAGTGKTTAAIARLLRLLDSGISGDSILLIVPQRTLAAPYEQVLALPGAATGGLVTTVTVGGLAQRMLDLFWPLVAEPAGFARPNEPPTYLTLETAQYYMAHLVSPLFDQGYFESIVVDHNRLYSQIIDNLNKAAVVGFPMEQIATRLKSAWVGEPGQLRVYDDVQACSAIFRQYCYDHNLLDFSLQVEVFFRHLWPDPACRDYLQAQYRHLYMDNVEEDTPVAHDLLRDWLPHTDSALLVADHDAGFRSFLGADPLSAVSLSEECPARFAFEASMVACPEVQSLSVRLARALHQPAERAVPQPPPAAAPGSQAVHFEIHHYYPDMLDWVARQIASLVHDQGVPPAEIVVLAPFLSDALRFALSHRLQQAGIPARSHRPSRSLREEPATQCLLTLAALAHPEWLVIPTHFDLAYALMQAIAGMDLVRAQLLAENALRTHNGLPVLAPWERLKPEFQERVSYLLGQRYETLRQWLAGYQQPAEGFLGLELDHFLSRLFGEVLSQPGFGFHTDYTAGTVTANLIESVQKFRWAIAPVLAEEGRPLGQEYIAMVKAGVIASQYMRSWEGQSDGAVLLAPAYTFLLANRPVQIQFWLDIGSHAWSERLEQPLTHPYVLNRNWPEGKRWTDIEELETASERLFCIVTGLLRRCRSRVYLGLSQLGEQGYEQRGPLLHAFQRVLQETNLAG